MILSLNFPLKRISTFTIIRFKSIASLGGFDEPVNIKALILTGSSKPPKLAILLNLIIVKVDILFNGKFNESIIMDRLTMRRFNAEFKPNRTPNDWISSDKNSVNDYTDDPHCGFIVTSGLK